MAARVKPEPPPVETWQAHDNPHRLVGWSRRVGGPRKYLLLACAVARHSLRAGDTDAGRRVLDYLEGVARGPKAGLAGRLVEDHLQPRFRGLFQPNFARLTPAGRKALVVGGVEWTAVFGRHAGYPARATKSVANGMIALALTHGRAAVAAEVTAEVGAIQRELAGRPRPKGTGRFGPLLGWLRADPGPDVAGLTAAVLARLPADRRPTPPAGWPPSLLPGWASQQLQLHRVEEGRRRLCDLVREVFGDPFRPWRVPPGWAEANAEAACRVARHVDAAGEYGAMPVLADALEEAGDHPQAVAHCRSAGPHAPGCWVIDTLLGR